MNDYIVSDSEICEGSLTFKGTRILIGQVIELLGAGVTIEEIIERPIRSKKFLEEL